MLDSIHFLTAIIIIFNTLPNLFIEMFNISWIGIKTFGYLKKIYTPYIFSHKYVILMLIIEIIVEICVFKINQNKLLFIEGVSLIIGNVWTVESWT